MRLRKIKLSGFKSFVDPTIIDFPQNLVGIVGPNGCGKSNVIDAVRWVMGESSAKQLRGESIADVIFNGSSSRKPVGQAQVELIFDNEGGVLGGEYARYAEISLKRQVTREGGSLYYLNGTKCRRKDIIEIFLGTGLGSRSYAIIEQGMISRLIEAKPDELRVYLEEAAGISKYKERRKETESRIEQTLTNVARLNDIVSELEKQLQKLHHQAKTAEKHQKYKREESDCITRLYACRFKKTNEALQEVEKKIEKITNHKSEIEAVIIGLSSQIDTQRTAYQEAHQFFNQAQGEYYEMSAELSRGQQVLELAQKREKELRLEMQTTTTLLNEAKQNYDREQKTLSEIENTQKTIEPKWVQVEERIQNSTEDLKKAEDARDNWQEKWDAFNQEAHKTREQAELLRSKLLWKEEELNKIRGHFVELTAEYQNLEIDSASDSHRVLSIEHQAFLEKETKKLTEKKAVLERLNVLQNELLVIESTFDREQTAIAELKGELASLVTLQEIALGIRHKKTTEKTLLSASKVTEIIKVEKGYEKAVELGLGMMLGAYCVSCITSDEANLVLADDALAMIELNKEDLDSPCGEDLGWGGVSLAQKIQAPAPICELLAGIYVAESISEALTHRRHLKLSESILTPEGIWFGRNWIKRLSESQEKTGVLEREEEIRVLKKKLADIVVNAEALQKQVEHLRSEHKELEDDKENQEQEWEKLQKAMSELCVKTGAAETKLKTLEAKKVSLQKTLSQLNEESECIEATLAQSRIELEILNEKEARHNETQSVLLLDKNACYQTLSTAKAALKIVEEERHELNLLQHSLVAKKAHTQENLERFKKEIEDLKHKASGLEKEAETLPLHILGHQEKFQHLLSEQKNKETLLTEARKSVEAIEHNLKELEGGKYKQEQALHEILQKTEQEKLNAQALQLKGNQYQERVQEAGGTLDGALSALLPEFTEENYQHDLERVQERLVRLGPINLMAIEEHKELSERKAHLDTQCLDLKQALDTLREAIHKIDAETRARFKETFEAINQHLRALFPKVFGGGEAYLEMTGTEILDAGVTVMARPPGKRNSSIHLLSGGEKALTAIALVFSIFQLNPAPFCMLDEVDAPLDDANVLRYCRLLKEMANGIQFIFVTHNKNTMELAAQLIGVTMQEAGVSRLVGVDLNEAVAWAGV